MSRRVYSNPPADALIMAFAPYVVGAIALYFITRKAKSELPAKYAEIKQAAGEIKAGLPGYLSDKLRGRNDSTYITAEEQKRRAEALLALKRAQQTVAGFAPVVYGS